MANKFLKFLRIFLAILGFIIIMFFLAQDLAWSGKLIVQTDFLKFTPYFSILKPQDRIEIKAVNYIKAEPAYFDLYLPRDFKTAKLELELKDYFDYPIKVGPNIGADWDLKSLEGNLPAAANGYKIKSIEFNLAGTNINNGKLRFIISIPGLKDENKGIYLKNLKITLSREPLWQNNIYQNILSYLEYVKNQF